MNIINVWNGNVYFPKSKEVYAFKFDQILDKDKEYVLDFFIETMNSFFKDFNVGVELIKTSWNSYKMACNVDMGYEFVAYKTSNLDSYYFVINKNSKIIQIIPSKYFENNYEK